MVGKEIHHYKILEKLGEGGMDVVYKAQDTKLDRTVALKFLPTHSHGSDDDRKRFETEAKAAAALNHPNIATVYEINDHEGDTFIAMELDAGALVLFPGRNSMHCVTPVKGNRTRMKLVLTYNTKPGISLSESAPMTFFGRLG